MKKTRLISLALALVVLAACFSFYGCNGAEEKITVNVKVSVVDNLGNVIFGPVDTVVVRDHQPTVVDAVVEALSVNEFKYEQYEDTSFMSIGDLKEKVQDEDGVNITYFWEYAINGVVPTAGRSFTNTVNEGDVIVYNYVRIPTAELIAAEGK